MIDVKGNLKEVLHPQLGVVKTDTAPRRSMKDFPPVAWFTNRIDIPNVLIVPAMYFDDRKSGEVRRVEIEASVAHGMSLNRVALGFPFADIGVTPWPEYGSASISVQISSLQRQHPSAKQSTPARPYMARLSIFNLLI